MMMRCSSHPNRLSFGPGTWAFRFSRPLFFREFVAACPMDPLLYQVDAFTDTPFTGNPAGVCMLTRERNPSWMQDVAAEMSLSETAFLQPRGEDAYRLRWFTPTHEVDLCGHATLASAHVLWSDGFVSRNSTVQFETKSGSLTATRDGAWTIMDFPAEPVTSIQAADALLDGLALHEPVFLGRTDRDYFVHCASIDRVRTLDPNMEILAGLDCRGVIVTAEAPTGDADFVSRFFAPGVGVPEDPVTGSAHCALGPYWIEKIGAPSLTGRQISQRGGTVHVEMESATATRIALSGQATIVIRGRLTD